jgi:hypothetical protein
LCGADFEEEKRILVAVKTLIDALMRNSRSCANFLTDFLNFEFFY